MYELSKNKEKKRNEQAGWYCVGSIMFSEINCTSNYDSMHTRYPGHQFMGMEGGIVAARV